jgi:predicted small lipoprotein YifL
MKASFKPVLLALGLTLSLAACGSNNANDESSNKDANTSDTSLMDTTMSTGTGTDNVKDSLKEGVDGTGKGNTDPRTRKQQ